MLIKQLSGEIEFRDKFGYNEVLNFFFSENYKNYKLSTKSKNREYLYLCSNDFVIPVLLHKYIIFCYAEFLSEPSRYNDSGEQENVFIDEICLYLKKKLKVQWLLSTPVHAFFQSYPKSSKVIRFGSQVIDLTQTRESLFQKMDRKHREMTRRGEKGGVIVKIATNELVNDFCSIETKLWERSGITIDNTHNSYYDLLFEHIGQNARICLAYKNDYPQVGLIVFFNEKIAYAMHAGRANEMEPGANNLLYWKVIEYLKSMNIEKFSIVGFRINPDVDSKIFDIQRFKSRFGGKLEEGYMFKIDFKPFYHRLFDILIDLLSLLKGRHNRNSKDIIDQEIHKWIELQK